MAFVRPAMLCAVAISLVTITALAKRVVCVDGCNTAFVNNHEGYERSLTNGTTDIVSVGGNLTACLSNLVSGDTLVIVAHGSGGGAGFVWGGMVYTNFGGTNAGSMPLPTGFGGLTNVTVRFCSCWSASTTVPNSMVQKLLDQMGAGVGNTGGGFRDYSIASLCYRVSGGTATNRQAAIACLRAMPGWMGNPPVNRTPPATPNQQTAAQAVVDACPGAGGASNLTVTITGYKVPYNSTNAAPGAGNASEGCGCAGSEPFCGIAEAILEHPDLNIARVAASSPTVVLSWPAEFIDYHLELAESLNGEPFTPYLGPTVEDAQRCSATIDASGPQGFFRLQGTPTCPLYITQPPQSRTAQAGQRVTFSVQAGGAPGPTLYQWLRVAGGPPMPIPGADGPSYTTPPLTLQDNNTQYLCFMSNGCNNIQSPPAQLIVFP
jgi:hypothetical protein